MIVIDDVVDKQVQDAIEKAVFGSATQWVFARSMFQDTANPEADEHQKNSLLFFTSFVTELDAQRLYTHPIVEACKKLNTSLDSIFHIRMLLQLPVVLEQNKIHGVPHVDTPRSAPYNVGVYYVNDTDGDTYIFKQTSASPVNVLQDKFTTAHTVAPKKGRLIIFNSDTYHAVGKPKKDIRAVINYHFTTSNHEKQSIDLPRT